MEALNPLTDEPLSEEAAEYVEKLRTIRRNARKEARSGNPAKSGPARNVLYHTPRMIAAVYTKEATA